MWPSVAPAAPGTKLEPPGVYLARLVVAQKELAAIESSLEALAAAASEDGTGVPPSQYAALQKRLHQGELGQFWATARAADRYIEAGLPGERGALARDQADLFSLLPERTGPLAALLRPDWDNPDDPLCLVYSCVNDPGAPPSINTLYALKLLHVGLVLGGGGDKRVTPQGLLANVGDARDKLSEYTGIVELAEGKVRGGLLGPDGALAGARGPPPVARKFGPSPLG